MDLRDPNSQNQDPIFTNYRVPDHEARVLAPRTLAGPWYTLCIGPALYEPHGLNRLLQGLPRKTICAQSCSWHMPTYARQPFRSRC